MKAVRSGLISFPGQEDTQHGLLKQDWGVSVCVGVCVWRGREDWKSLLSVCPQGLIVWAGVGGAGGVGRQEEEQ